MNYIPLYNEKTKTFITIPAKQLLIIVALCPLISFIACVIITMYKDFDEANHTHCNVNNVFPSISAAVGNYHPQRTIWKFGVYIHSPGRFLAIFLRFSYYKSIIKPSVSLVLTMAVLANIIENFALLGLTFWSSSELYAYHEKSFKTFIITSLIYMITLNVLLTKFNRNIQLSLMEEYSIRLKWRCTFVYITAVAFVCYFFFRHNLYCEPYVYSMFALSEYVVVFTNIGYHATSAYDLHRISYVMLTTIKHRRSIIVFCIIIFILNTTSMVYLLKI